MNAQQQPHGNAAFQFWIVVGLALFLAGRGAAAEPYRPAFSDPLEEPWRWRSFPELSGLGAQCLAEAADGSIWFGTVDGAWSYDGFDWASHSTLEGLSGGVATFCRASDGTLHAGGRWGIRRLEGTSWSRAFPPQGRSFGEVRRLLAGRDGSVWAATSWGALRLKHGQATLFTGGDTALRLAADTTGLFAAVHTMPAPVLEELRNGAAPPRRHDLADIGEDPSGRVWLATTSGEVLSFRPEAAPGGGEWTLHNEADGMACGRDPSLLALRDGTVWVTYGASSGHANLFGDGVWRAIRLEDLGMPGDCGHLIQTRDGAVWFSGRYVIGVHRDGVWRAYRKPEFPIPSARNSLLESSDGALWIAGPDTEVQRIDHMTPRWETFRDLNFHWESPAGAKWFLHRDGSVVVHEGGSWTRHGTEDGVIDTPVLLLGTRRGEVWAAGSHGHTAATARFADGRWTRFIHGEFSWGVEWRNALESSDGSVWFAAAVDSSGPKEHRVGLLRFHNGVWHHHHQPERAPSGGGDPNPAILLPATQRPEPVGKFLSLGESPDGKIWAGRNLVVFHDGQKWSTFAPAPELRLGVVETMFTDRATNLWIGTRQFGATRFDGRAWHRFQGKDSLVANSVRSLAQTADGTVWAATDRGASRFDGHGWTADLLPAQLAVPHDGGAFKADAAGDLWINRFPPEWTRRAWPKATPSAVAKGGFWTVRHRFRGIPPETRIISGPKEVSHHGNLAVHWSGATPWREPAESRLRFSYRLDDGPWSEFLDTPGHSFFSLSSGPHRVEVRARDQDFNVDPTPAVLGFTVLPPVWRQGWFVLLICLLTGTAVAQTVRVVLDRRRLRRANRELAAEIEERQRTQEVMRASNARYAREESALMTLTRAFAQQPLGGDGLLREVLQVAAETLEVDRAGVWRYDAGSRSLTCRELHVRRGGPGPGPAALEGGQFSDYFRALEEGSVIAADDARNDPRTAGFTEAYLRPNGIGAMLDAPIHVSGRVAGVFCAEHVGPARAWTVDEQTFAIAVANVVSLLLAEEGRQAVEEQLRQSQKLEAIGQLAGGVAHDFNNMLTVVIMQVDLAAMDADLPRHIRDGLGDIRSAVQRAANLTRQLLLFSRRQPMQPKVLDLNETVTSLAKMLQRIIGEDIRLLLALHPAPLPVRADGGMLDQVLMNLAVNARDAMPGGGRLALATAETEVDAETARRHPGVSPGRYARLTVSDTGTGISPENLERIFEPFFTTKEPGKGTGLGLATVFGIVQQHGGWLEVSSTVGRGTAFHVFLPLAPSAIGPETAPAIRTVPRGGGETLLVVEDELPVRALARTALERAGYRVLEAANGTEALRIWEDRHGEVDLLLADLVLPGGMGGRALADRLRASHPGLKVVFTSGYSSGFSGRELDVSAHETFLQKPFGPDQLLETVRQCLDR